MFNRNNDDDESKIYILRYEMDETWKDEKIFIKINIDLLFCWQKPTECQSVYIFSCTMLLNVLTRL